MSETKNPAGPPLEQKPFVAPCRDLSPRAPLRWLSAGWRDLRASPGQSLAWGFIVLALSWGVSLLAYGLGRYMLLLSVLSGFVFIGPLLAVALYSISSQLERGRVPTFQRSVLEARRHLSNCMVFALVLLVIFLVWARAASMVHVFFPVESNPDWRDVARFLGIGSAVGSIFAAITFAASAFSLPMIMDRQVDTVTAVVTSVNAALRNKVTMAVWILLIVLFTALGFATAFIGMVVLFPLIGHATWHSYRETIDASEWPRHEDPGIT